MDWQPFTRDQARHVFGDPEKPEFQRKWCVMYYPPQVIADRLINFVTKKPTTKIWVNRCMVDALDRAFKNVIARGLVDELVTFDGCLEIRAVRGGSDLSWHAYALAIDLNAATNPLGGPIGFSAGLVACFVDEGFTWGGRFKRVDGMHFQYGVG